MIRVALVGLLAVSFVYPVCAMPARIIAAQRGGDRSKRKPTLHAFNFTRHRPTWAVEAKMLDWIRENVPPGEVVAEAAWPKAYDYGGRVASLGGRPVPIGWAHHEQQWRGLPAFKAIADRQEAVNHFYRGKPKPGEPTDANEDPIQRMRRQAELLGFDWVLYGILEAKHYGPEALERLRQAGRLAAEFPERRPSIFLFDFRDRDSKMEVP